MLNYNTHTESLVNPVRSVYAGVEVYSSTLENTFTDRDKLRTFNIDRQGETDKFFGYGICQRINIKLIDTNRELEFTTSNRIRVKMSALSADTLEYIGTYFDIYDCYRDENTNALSITAYDRIKKCSEFYTKDIDVSECNCFRDYINVIVSFVGFAGVRFVFPSSGTEIFDLPHKANLEGSETLRDLLDDIAEASQTIYYLDVDNNLVFRRYDKDADAVYTITRDSYTLLDSGENRRLGTICHATELGDNVYASISESGSTQFIRDNDFWIDREDIKTLVENALDVYGGLTINQFFCSWRGDYRLELGDKIGIERKDNTIAYSYVLNDSLRYDGGMIMESEWEFKQSDSESASNPTSLGEMLKQTYARVDKANKEIELVASRNEDLAKEIAQIKIDTESINMSVSSTQQQFTTFQSETTTQISNMENSIQATEQLITENQTATNQMIAEMEQTVKQDTQQQIANSQSQTDQKLAEMQETIATDTQQQIDTGIAQAEQKIADLEDTISANTQEQINQGLAQTDQKLSEMEETISANTQQQITEGLAGTNEQITNLQNSVNQTQQQVTDNKTATDGQLADLNNSLSQTQQQVTDNKADADSQISNLNNKVDTNNTNTQQQIADNKAQTDADIADLDTRLNNTNEQLDNDRASTDVKIQQITNKVNAQLTPTDVRIEVEKIIQEQGEINAITTATGFTFNESGLNVTKSDSEMSTIISEDGMRIIKNTDTVLTANNVGVDAKNLHATTYLIIGFNSRFEDYDNNTRTGCFWIGD